MELSNLTADEVQKLCVRFCQDENCKILRYEVTGMSDAPKGYLGRHQYLNVVVQRNTKSGIVEQDVRFFMKTAPLDISSHMEYVEGFGVFKKEISVYKNIIPRLQSINIGGEYFAPKCFLAKDNVLVFDNLAEQGFRIGTIDGGILDFDHLNCALKSLANLHATSIVLENRTNRTIPEMYSSAVEENSYPSDPNNIRAIVFHKAAEALSELLQEIPKYKKSAELQKILEKFRKVLEMIFEFVKPSKRWRNTFSHGDLWANNLMFKYRRGSMKNIPIECRLVDFQLARYSPPVLDVMTLLTIPTTSTFRKENLTDLLDIYYNFLRIYLAKYELNVEKIIPKSEFDETVEYFKLAGLVESCLFSHLTCMSAEFTTGLLQNSDNFDEFLIKQRGDICRKAFINDNTYRERMTDMISEIVDTYILKEMEA